MKGWIITIIYTEGRSHDSNDEDKYWKDHRRMQKDAKLQERLNV